MDVRRLSAVAEAVVTDWSQLNVAALLERIENAYSQSITTPTADIANVFDAALHALEVAMEQSACSVLSPSRKKILAEIGGESLCGIALTNAVKVAIGEAQTPASAMRTLQAIRAEATNLANILSGLQKSFLKIHITPEHPPEEGAEVEIMLPSTLVDQNLHDFAKEAKDLERALGDIVETATGARHPIILNGLGTGSYEIFVKIDLASGAALLVFITSIVQLINGIMQMRLLRTQIEAQKAPQNISDGLKNWEKERVDEELRRLVEQMADGYKKKDTGRKAELKSSLSKSLRYLADRIDRGMDIDVVVNSSSEDANANSVADAGVPQLESRKTIEQSMGAINLIERNEKPALAIAPPFASASNPRTRAKRTRKSTRGKPSGDDAKPSFS